MRAVIINIDKEKNRLYRIKSLFTEIGIEIERVSAVDGRDPVNSKLIFRHRHTSRLRPPVFDTDMACALSHRKAWELLLKSNESWLAVFEDDVHFGKNIAALLEEAWIPAGVELIKLETMMTRGSLGHRPVASIGGRQLHRLGGSNLGTAGYLVSRAAAARLMRLTEKVEMPIDSLMFDRRGPFMREAAVHQIVPAACIQEHVLARHEGRSDVLPSSMVRPDLPRPSTAKRLRIRLKYAFDRCASLLSFAGPDRELMGDEGPISFA